VSKVRGKRTVKRLPVVLTPKEADALLAGVVTRSTTGLRNRALFSVLLGAGLRVSEVVALKGVDVDLEQGLLRVVKGKGNRDRTVPIDQEVIGWLSAWEGKRAALKLTGKHPFFVAVRNGRFTLGSRKRTDPLRARSVGYLVKRAAVKVGIERKVSPHVLRHTYATLRLRNGFDLREVQELLGHSNVATTQVYTHVDPEALRQKVQAQAPTAEDPLVVAVKALTPEQRSALAAALGSFTTSKGTE